MKWRTYQASLLPTFSLVPSCWAAFKFVQGQSGAGYNPPASPVQHQQHSGRNILPPHLNTKHHQCGTVEPILLFFLSLLLLLLSCLFLFSLDYKCTGGQRRGWCYPQTRRSETGKKDSLEAQHALVRVKKRWARKGDKTWKEMSEKSKTKSFFSSPSSILMLVPGENRDWLVHLDWKSGSLPQKTRSFQTKWQMSPSICCLQSRVPRCPLGVHDGPYNG